MWVIFGANGFWAKGMGCVEKVFIINNYVLWNYS